MTKQNNAQKKDHPQVSTMWAQWLCWLWFHSLLLSALSQERGKCVWSDIEWYWKIYWLHPYYDLQWRELVWLTKEQPEPSTICEHWSIAHPEEDKRLRLQFLSPVKVSINDHFEAPVSSRTDGLGIIAPKGSSPCLHLVHKLAERRFFEVVL